MTTRSRTAGPPEPAAEPVTDDLDLPEPKRSVFLALATVRDLIQQQYTEGSTGIPAGATESQLAYRAGVNDCLSIVTQSALRVAGWPAPGSSR